MTTKKDHRATLKVPPELKQEIKVAAAQAGEEMYTLVERAWRSYTAHPDDSPIMQMSHSPIPGSDTIHPETNPVNIALQQHGSLLGQILIELRALASQVRGFTSSGGIRQHEPSPFNQAASEKIKERGAIRLKERQAAKNASRSLSRRKGSGKRTPEVGVG